MKIELCCASKKSISLSKIYPFSSVEICRKLSVGGLTPNANWVNENLPIKNKSIRILIRSRCGNFIYTNREKITMIKQMEKFSLLSPKIDGFVIGALINENFIDLKWLTEIRNIFPSKHFTFHRAFDDIKDKDKTLNQLIDIGFNRVLTSGNSKYKIEQNADELKSLIKKYDNKIEIAIGGGITENNIKFLIQNTKSNSFHFSGCVYKDKQFIPNTKKIESILNSLKSI